MGRTDARTRPCSNSSQPTGFRGIRLARNAPRVPDMTEHVTMPREPAGPRPNDIGNEGRPRPNHIDNASAWTRKTAQPQPEREGAGAWQLVHRRSRHRHPRAHEAAHDGPRPEAARIGIDALERFIEGRWVRGHPAARPPGTPAIRPRSSGRRRRTGRRRRPSNSCRLAARDGVGVLGHLDVARQRGAILDPDPLGVGDSPANASAPWPQGDR